jgi:hypothetical protein
MRKKCENNLRSAGKKCGPLDGIMISPLVLKVNPSHLADFAAFRAAGLWWKVLNPLFKSCGTPANLAGARLLWLGIKAV